MPWSLREHQKEPDRLAHMLYWQRLVEDGHDDVVWQNDNSFLSVLRYRGPDMESADKHELMALTARLHAVVLTLGEGWALHCEERRHEAAPYPVSQWRHPVAALLDEERRAQLGMPGTHFESTYHLTLTQDIPWSLGAWWQRLWWENIPEGHAQVDKVTAFRDEIARVTGELAGIVTDVELLVGEGLMTYLTSTVSESAQEVVGIPEDPYWLGYQLTDTSFLPGVTPKLGRQWLRPVIVKNEQRRVGWPKTTYPGILDSLHDLPMEYRAVWRWIPLSHAKADRELNLLENTYRGKHKSTWTQMRERASRQPSQKIDHAADVDADEISEARFVLNSGTALWGYLTMTVVVWDTDFAVAEAKRTQVEQVLRAKGFLASVEMIDPVGAWLGTLPGDRYNNVEKPLLTSLNFVHCMATTSVWAGPEWVPHLNGPPLLVVTARGHTPFRITTHEGDVGDFFMLGPKGSGKSTAGCAFAANWTKYHGAKVRGIDKGGSLKALTYAMGGNWVLLAPGSARPLQPYARIDDDAERAWAAEWTGDRLAEAHLPLTTEVTEEVWASLDALTDFAPQHRTVSGLCGLLGSPTLRQAMARYASGGPFEFFDGDEDWLALSDWDCFEMEKLLDDYPRLVPAAFSLIARRIEGALDGAPTFIPIDECHAYLQIEAVARRQLGWLKTFRRRNATLGFYTQNPRDIKNNPVGDELVQACPTRFFFPNPHALEPEVMAIYAGMGLTPRHCELLAIGVPKRDCLYMGQQGNRFYRMDLGPVGIAYCGRSQQTDLVRIDRVEATRTEPFGVAWLREEGQTMLANLLGEDYAQHDTPLETPWDGDRLGTLVRAGE